MKLHITPEQFRELPEEGQEFLREYAREKSVEHKEAYMVYGESLGIDEQVYVVQVNGPKKSSDMLPGYAVCFNIGQMIEFLCEKWDNPKIFWDWPWQVCMSPENEKKHKDFSAEELCDALWEAIKKAIKNG